MAEIPGFFAGTEMPTAGWWEALWPDPAAVLRKVGLQQAMSVVDLCAGDGWFTLQIAKLASRVWAIDIDGRLLESARQRLKEAKVGNVKLAPADAYQVQSIVGEAVDFVFMANAFHGVPDRTRMAGAVRGVLQDGGQFAIINWHQKPREETVVLGEPRGPKTELRMSPDETIESVEAGGLKFKSILDVPPYHYAAIFQR